MVDVFGAGRAQGRFDEGLDRFVVHAATGIVFTEPDMNELAQAKGANVAGLRITADVFGLRPEATERFYLAGGFARHIDPAAARRIGLVPDLPEEKLVRVGNACARGGLDGAPLARGPRAARGDREAGGAHSGHRFRRGTRAG